MLDKLLAADVNDQASFNLYIKNDPVFLAAQSQTQIDSTQGQDKGKEFDVFWKSVYGQASVPDELLRKGYQKTDGYTTFDEYFTEFIRPSAAFKTAIPGFEKLADATSGTPGGDNVVDPMDYFKTKQSLEQYYEILSEKPGASDSAMIQKAMDNNWSAARFELEFKNSPAYTGTAAYLAKAQQVDGYYKSIFGVDAVQPKDLQDTFARGVSTDVTSMFEDIKQTAEFKQQYGNWGEFQAAQDATGNSGRILADPAVYKQYKAAFYQAFADVGMTAPADYEKMFFSSGLDEQAITSNMKTYTDTQASYAWQTGESADVATAAGIGNKAAGGDLRTRMEAAIGQHRALANSKFNTYDTQQKNDFMVKKI